MVFGRGDRHPDLRCLRALPRSDGEHAARRSAEPSRNRSSAAVRGQGLGSGRGAGAIYMVKEADPDIALPRLFGGFLVVTGAKVTYEHDDRLVWERDLLVVNGRYVEMIYSATAQAARGALNDGNAA